MFARGRDDGNHLNKSLLDVVTVEIEDAAPHFLSGSGVSIRRTRGGDAFEMRTVERKSEPLLLGMPATRS